MKKLGFGFMRLPKINDDNENIDIEAVKDMVDHFLDQGFTYFDTAWFYHGQKSEQAIKESLVNRYDRNKFKLADKMPIALLDPEGKTPGELREELDSYFNTQLQRCGVEYFDYYLLHSLNHELFEKAQVYKAYEYILEKKEAGLIKNIGFSFHDTEPVLKEILDTYKKMDFVQLQINYLDWDHERIQSKKCYDLAKSYDMDIIIMEPVKGGTLAKLPDQAEKLMLAYKQDMSIASWAIRFAAGLENVFMVLSGMSNMDQLIDNISYMKDFKPLNLEEKAIIDRVISIIKESSTIQCTECQYCLLDCPKSIPIPTYFAQYNRDIQGLGFGQKEKYQETKSRKSGPEDCVRCGACETHCPQHLPIIKYLKNVEDYFSKKL